MIVRCGFPDCEWKAESKVVENIPTSEHDNGFMIAARVNIGLADELLLTGKLLDHQVNVHMVPEAVWGR